VALGYLRQFCAHPWLNDLFRDVTDATECSPKLVRLLEILEEIRDCGEKAIIFAGYKDAVDLIASEIERVLKVSATVIDGRTPVGGRQKLVDDFTEFQGSAVLVMIPRATGVGLNITAANHVIHYTPEWNPAVEDQASARAYRRGQSKVVRVHRLFYSGTVEEVMNDRMGSKRDLAEAAVVGSDGTNIETGDLLRALTITPGKTYE
jgi:SNF2 family DNA or RNA helicase